jgi:hypothetical protein
VIVHPPSVGCQSRCIDGRNGHFLACGQGNYQDKIEATKNGENCVVSDWRIMPAFAG